MCKALRDDRLKPLLTGKAAYLGGVIAVDAVAHLPLVGFFVPGPMEFVGTAAAVLLASRYYVTKDSTPSEDISNFVAGISPEIPQPDDVVRPVTTLAEKFEVPDFAVVQQDVTGRVLLHRSLFYLFFHCFSWFFCWKRLCSTQLNHPPVSDANVIKKGLGLKTKL